MKIGDEVYVTHGNHAGVRGVIVGFRGVGSLERAEIRLGSHPRNCVFGVPVQYLEVTDE